MLYLYMLYYISINKIYTTINVIRTLNNNRNFATFSFFPFKREPKTNSKEPKLSRVHTI